MTRRFRALTVAVLAVATALVAPIATSAFGTPVPFVFEPTELPGQNPYVVALSADGQDAYLAESPGYLFASHDAGDTWSQMTLTQEGWIAIATSSNGQVVYAAKYGGEIMKSTNSGTSWSTLTAGVKSWETLANSADGVYVYAGAEYDGIYRSADSGGTWTKTSLPSEISRGIAISDDGATVYAAISGNINPLRVSTDYGVTWSNTRASFAEWTADSVAVTADGSTVIASAAGDRSSGPGGSCCSGVWKSTDVGQNWTRIFYPETYNNYPHVSISSDGSVITVGTRAPNNGVFISQDSGATWTNSIPSIDGHAVVSRDGAVVIATDSVSKVYVTLSNSVSTDATLSGLSISKGTLSPVFSTNSATYTASVGNTVSSVNVTATTTDPGATLKIKGESATSGVAKSVALSVGANRIPVVITAEDGTTEKTYTISVTRAPSNVATLAHLRVSTGALSPAFASSKKSYSVSVAKTVSSIKLTATVAQAQAALAIGGKAATSGSPCTVNLATGLNKIRVVVTAQDGTTRQTYTVSVTRAR